MVAEKGQAAAARAEAKSRFESAFRGHVTRPKAAHRLAEAAHKDRPLIIAWPIRPSENPLRPSH